MKVWIKIGDAVDAIQRNLRTMRKAFEFLGRKITMPRLDVSKVVENQCLALRTWSVCGYYSRNARRVI